jgi:hypothetical protein
MHRGDNEELLDDEQALKDLEKKTNRSIEITEEIYNNAEYGEIPDWIDVTIKDEGVLPFKMARGVIKALDGASAITFEKFFDINVSEEWGGYFRPRLEIFGDRGVYVAFNAKHASEEIEVDISSFFNQTIGD